MATRYTIDKHSDLYRFAHLFQSEEDRRETVSCCKLYGMVLATAYVLCVLTMFGLVFTVLALLLAYKVAMELLVPILLGIVEIGAWLIAGAHGEVGQYGQFVLLLMNLASVAGVILLVAVLFQRLSKWQPKGKMATIAAYLKTLRDRLCPMYQVV